MPTNDVIVRVKGEAELAEMRSETQRTFARVESDARDTAAAIELPFDQAGRAIPQAFESAERGLREPLARVERTAAGSADGVSRAWVDAGHEVSRSFDDAGTDIAQDLSRAGAAGDRAADDLGGSFDDSATRVSRAFDGAESQVRADLSDLADAGDRSAAAIDDAFSDAGAGVAEAFDGAESRIRADLSGLGDAGDRAAIGIRDSFDESASRVSSSFDGVRTDVESDLSQLGGAGDRAAAGIRDAFDDAADRVSRSFDQLPADLRQPLDRVETIAASSADDVAEQLSGIGGRVDFSSLGGSIVDQIQGLASSAAGPIAVAGGLLGAAFADDVADGISGGFGRRRGMVTDALRTGIDDSEIRSIANDAAEIFVDGFGDSVAELRFEAAALKKEFEGFELGGTNAEITKQANTLQELFGVELPRSVQIARRAVANDLVPDVESGLNLIFQLGRELPLTFDEGLDVLDEYAATLGPLNLSQEQLVDLLADIERSGAFENIDKGADALREFNNRLTTTGELDDVLAEIGLDAERLRDAFASGNGPAAINAVVDALVAYGDASVAGEAAAKIFGSAVEDSTDRIKAVQAIRIDETVDGFTISLREGTEAVEENRSAWDRLGRDVVVASSAIGGSLDRIVTDTYEVNDALTDTEAGAGRFARTFGIDIPALVSQGFAGVGGVVAGTSDVITLLNDGLGAGERQSTLYSRALDSVARSVEIAGDETGEAADNFSLAARAVGDLRAELDDLFGFDADQLMRRIADETDRLAEVAGEADASMVGLNGEIDITTEAGRDLQAQFERVADTQRDLVEALNDGSISAAEFSERNSEIEASLRDVIAGMGITGDAADELLDKYFAWPDELRTVINIDYGFSQDFLDGLESQFQRLARGYTVPINLRPSNYTPPAPSPSRPLSSGGGSKQNFRAEGGPTIGETVLGEDGPELAQSGGRTRLYGQGGIEVVDFEQVATIYSADETQRVLAERPGLQVEIPDRDTGGVRQVLAEDLSRMLARQDGAVPRMSGGGAARDERLVVIGDNFGAQYDPEVASPLSLMTKAMRDALKEHRPGPMVVIQQVVVRNERDADRFAHKLEQVLRASPA